MPEQVQPSVTEQGFYGSQRPRLNEYLTIVKVQLVPASSAPARTSTHGIPVVPHTDEQPFGYLHFLLGNIDWIFMGF